MSYKTARSKAIENILKSRGQAGPSTGKALSDRMMKEMIPMFVESKVPDDHKCGSCFMRVECSSDRTECTIVSGGISQSKGTCLYWAIRIVTGKQLPHL